MHRPDTPREPVAGPDSGPAPPFPLRLDGEVIKGFGRGSKEVPDHLVPYLPDHIRLTHPPLPQLGIPTANLPIEGLAIGGHDDLQSGVYYGWASLSSYDSAKDQSTSHSLPAVDGAAEGTAPSRPQQTDLVPAVGKEGVFPMCMSIGWNPYYKNEKRSVEVHIMHSFARDFYGARMKVLILGFIRPEYDYTSLEGLVEDIRTDIDVSLKSLKREGYEKLRDEGWLVDF
ncbi:Riboflavin kinase [Sphaceloma murrayae]|uniref:Riboflavin kinase n=1 Tax=Sphaceloma murrayae TaxID=2082308 RepID=A0A2K1QGE0_9PEZI|nr:Riboflavin kinase [Sphaceloma murrayae]